MNNRFLQLLKDAMTNKEKVGLGGPDRPGSELIGKIIEIDEKNNVVCLDNLPHGVYWVPFDRVLYVRTKVGP